MKNPGYAPFLLVLRTRVVIRRAGAPQTRGKGVGIVGIDLVSLSLPYGFLRRDLSFEFASKGLSPIDTVDR